MALSSADVEQLNAAPIPPSVHDRIKRIEYLANLLDSRFGIPGTGIRFGLDGLIGLIPGIGDTVSGALSAYIISEAARAGVRKRALVHMIWNASIDWILGSIPLLGDIFDVAFKANRKNADIAIRELHRLAGAA
ncbi:MAG: hypothetical protein CL558_01490 [Alphaproteobacteria bacterium]|nr:hypothetical protein [Alphaproteobacteria bacterium]MAS47463.1 hypothetical protein [Alphaproteobacteria bacterium]MAX96665.1 hypothetical protein [Alphaproteobacteria bacterium]MBN52230.1 hypothetical protein [Alphaproteobacteria bacterium]OUT41040.1 MAG: hypothetical protein CBB62_01355 [Micavibrio sp. TMED2]|tara:strand:- start:15212 stop:15613 length:402 start_codon:yes stop_codon:yes gene_type:complete